MLYDDAEEVKDKGLTGKQARSLTGLQSFGLIAFGAVCLYCILTLPIDPSTTLRERNGAVMKRFVSLL